MNRQAVMKLMKAKRLEYEALKEMMPEKMAKCMKHLEDEIMEFAKEYLMTMICNTPGKDENAATDAKTGVRKVTIE